MKQFKYGALEWESDENVRSIISFRGKHIGSGVIYREMLSFSARKKYSHFNSELS